MKTMDEITKQVVVDIKTNPNFKYRAPFGYDEEITEDDYKLINELFKTFMTIFPAFRQAWPTQDDFQRAKREWIKSFKLANLSDAEKIKRGVDRFRLAPTPFVPSPGQFIAMCDEFPKNEERCKIPFYAKSALESDSLKEKRKKDARRHLDALYDKLK